MNLTPSRSAVLAIHLQDDIVGAEGAFAPMFQEQIAARGVLDRIEELLHAARSAGTRIAYTRVAWAPDYNDLHPNSPLLQFVVQAGALKEGSPQSQITGRVSPAPDDLVHTHRRIGGYNDDLDQWLRSSEVDTVILCGVATNVSVEGTARQLSDAGYQVVIVEDACSAGTADAHQASIASLGLIGTISSTADVVAALAGEPATSTA